MGIFEGNREETIRQGEVEDQSLVGMIEWQSASAAWFRCNQGYIKGVNVGKKENRKKMRNDTGFEMNK